MSKVMKTTAKDPITGKTLSKTITINKFNNEEEAKEYLKKWREGVKNTKKESTIEPIIEPIIEKTNNIINNDLEFKKFDLILDYTTGNTLLSLGSSKAGKTTLLKHIYKNYFEDKKDFISILFAENAHSKTYDEINKKVIKTHIFYPDVVKKIHKIQRGTKNKYKFLLMFDDIVDAGLKNTDIIKKLITSYRNSNITSYISIQSPKLVNKTNRGNLNYITFHAFRNDEEVKEVMYMFLGSKIPFKGLKEDEKVHLYNKLTENYNFLFLNTLENKLYRSKINI
jgi:hypothetical protein